MEPRDPTLPSPARESARVAPTLDVPHGVDDPGAIEYASWLRLLRQSTPQSARPTPRAETR